MRCKVIFYFECFSLRFNFNFGFCSFQKVQNAVEFTKIHICRCDSSAPDPAGGLWPLPQTSLWGPHVLAWHMKWLQVTCPKDHLSEMEMCRFRNLTLTLTLALAINLTLCLYVSNKWPFGSIFFRISVLRCRGQVVGRTRFQIGMTGADQSRYLRSDE